MPTQETNQGQFIRWVKKYGDGPLFRAMIRGVYLKRLVAKDKKLAWDILRDNIQFMTAMFADSLGCIFRHKHGTQTRGVILSLCTTILIIVFNSTKAIFIIKPAMFWASPLYLVKNSIVDMVFVEVHSIGLLIFGLIYLSLSLWHSIMGFIGKGNRILTKRGESWLFEKLLADRGLREDYMVQGWIEPSLVALVAWGIWALGDKVFAVYLWIAAISMFTQEQLDKAKRMENQTTVE